MLSSRNIDPDDFGREPNRERRALIADMRDLVVLVSCLKSRIGTESWNQAYLKLGPEAKQILNVVISIDNLDQEKLREKVCARVLKPAEQPEESESRLLREYNIAIASVAVHAVLQRMMTYIEEMELQKQFGDEVASSGANDLLSSLIFASAHDAGNRESNTLGAMVLNEAASRLGIDRTEQRLEKCVASHLHIFNSLIEENKSC